MSTFPFPVISINFVFPNLGFVAVLLLSCKLGSPIQFFWLFNYFSQSKAAGNQLRAYFGTS